MKDFINKDMDISLAEKFNIGPGQYSNISVTELPFSIRVINRFRGNGIQTVGDMLSRTENELSKFRGFGANCLKEIEAYCIHLSQENDDSIAHSSFNMKPRVHALVSNNLSKLAVGDFSFVADYSLSEEEQANLDEIKEAYQTLGQDLVYDCINNKDSIVPLFEMFRDFEAKLAQHHNINSYLSCATEIKNDSVSLEKIMRQYFDVVAPFEDNEKKKNEFPDAIIIESIKLRDNRDELLYVITDDHGWANAFPEGNEYNVKVIDDIYTMTTQVAQVLLDNDILSNIQNELKDQLLEKVKTWLEDYDYTDIAENIDDGVIECDELDSATIKSINLFFNGIDYVDREDRTATLDFSVESSVEINYSYIDHSEETYDREDDVYYNTKHGEATSIINLTIPMEVFVTVLEITDENKDNILDIDDIDFDSIDIKHIETN